MKLIIFISLCSPLFVFSQNISFNYPTAGSVLITERVTNDKKKERQPFTIDLKYYYKNNTLNYYLVYNYENYRTERIKIMTKQYDIIPTDKSYTFIDSTSDINFRFFGIHNFIDANYINKQIASNLIKKTDTTILQEAYIKYSFRYIEDSISFGGEGEKTALQVIHDNVYLVDKKTNRMYQYLTIANSKMIYIKDESIASNWKEESVNEMEKFIYEKEKYITGNYINKTTKNEDSTANLYKLKTEIKPDKIQSLHFELASGEKLNFMNIKEDYILLDFWFTSCFPCLKSIPELNKLQDDFKGKLKIIGIDVQKEDAKGIKKFIKEKGINYDIATDYEKTIHNLFNIFVCPTWLLYDKTGKFINSYVGYSKDTYETISKAILKNP